MAEQILDLDMGNSRSKWILRDISSGVMKRGVCKNADLHGELQILKQINITRVRVACVAGDNERKKLRELCKSLWDVQAEFAVSAISCAGLGNAYDNPEQLGVDRWLAALAAWKCANGAPCLIIDAGSALTIDTIDGNGMFLGGYIIPGLVMMQQSLVSNTGKIASDIESRIHKNFVKFPTNTGQAIHWGACFAVSAAVEKSVTDFLLLWPHGRVFVTGGGGVDIAETVGLQDTYQPDLVLYGLAWVLP